ncbi:hypothetical protein B296_00039384 [Ensete ventricosum]|uniref:Uncharacterized protein n=1 Tax=Ensete ventricosum TaxID=4639 RepID=A0A426ZTX1_ENSVE|nr:hypothetical protein B296_00039384 [Ensete ventricosum]
MASGWEMCGDWRSDAHPVHCVLPGTDASCMLWLIMSLSRELCVDICHTASTNRELEFFLMDYLELPPVQLCQCKISRCSNAHSLNHESKYY